MVAWTGCSASKYSGMVAPAATVFRRAASASYGPKKLLGNTSSVSGSMVSFFGFDCPAEVISLLATVPSSTTV